MGKFFIPETILSGNGSMNQIGSYAGSFGKKCLIVCGKSTVRNGLHNRLDLLLTEHNISCAVFDGISGEPTDVMITEGLEKYRSEECDFLIGVGGGSSIDAMKAIAMTAVYDGRLSDYIGVEIDSTLPNMIAVPTTAGTGSEATQFTIITDTETGVKMLLKGRSLMPKLAVVDPELTVTSPKGVTVSTGLDALTHAIEAYTSRKAQPLSDTLAISAVKRIFQYLPLVIQNGDDHDARAQMSIAALEAGIAFNNSSVTLVHGMSRPIGALFHVPHGISNAMLLNVCLDFAKPGAVSRFADLGRAIGAADRFFSDAEAADVFMQVLNDLCGKCGILTLSAYGIDKTAFFNQIDKMAHDAIVSGSPANTIRDISEQDIKMLYQSLW